MVLARRVQSNFVSRHGGFALENARDTYERNSNYPFDRCGATCQVMVMAVGSYPDCATEGRPFASVMNTMQPASYVVPTRTNAHAEQT